MKNPFLPTLLILAHAAIMPPSLPLSAAEGEGLPVADLQRTRAVDFEKEILPFFRDNCLACHNTTKAKGGLNLETPKHIRAGGDTGAALVPGKGSESLLFQAAGHRWESIMPPEGNKSGAKNLNPEQLALLRLWIDQGATGEVLGSKPVNWQPLPPALQPIFAVALAQDGGLAACSRANQVFVYDLASGELDARLQDPELERDGLYPRFGAAHRDQVNALAFHPNGRLLATGGYRQVSLWEHRPFAPVREWLLPQEPLVASLHTVSGRLAVGSQGGTVDVWSVDEGRRGVMLKKLPEPVRALDWSPDGRHLAVACGKELRVYSPQGLLEAVWPAGAAGVLGWDADNHRLWAGHEDGILRLWQPAVPVKKAGTADKDAAGDTPKKEAADSDLPKWAEAGAWKGHKGPILTLQPPRGKHPNPVTGGSDGTVKVWDPSKPAPVRSWSHGAPIRVLQRRETDGFLLSAGEKGTWKVWNPTQDKPVAEGQGLPALEEAVTLAEIRDKAATGNVGFFKGRADGIEKEQVKLAEALKKTEEADRKAAAELAAKEKAVKEAEAAKVQADKALAELEQSVKQVGEAWQKAEAEQAKAKAAVRAAQETVLAAEREAGVAERSAAEARRLAETAAQGADPKAKPGEVARMAAELAEAAAKKAAVAKARVAEVRKQGDAALDTLASRSFAAGQLKPEYDRVQKESPEQIKLATAKQAAAVKALEAAAKTRDTAGQAREKAGQDLELSKRQLADLERRLADARKVQARAEEKATQAAAVLKQSREQAVAALQPWQFATDRWMLGGGKFALLPLHGIAARPGIPVTPPDAEALLAAFSWKEDQIILVGTHRRVRIWNPAGEWVLRERLGDGGLKSPIIDRVNALAFSPDGRFLVSGGGEPSRSGEILIWEPGSDKAPRSLSGVHSDTVLALAFNLAGDRLASGGSDRFVKVLDPVTGKVEKVFEGHTHHVLGVSWRADGRVLASAGADNMIKTWDLVEDKRLKNITGYNKEVTAVHYLAGNDQTLTASGDPVVRLVDGNGKNLRNFAGATSFVHAATVTPDGQRVAAGGQDGVLRIWNADDGKLLQSFDPVTRISANETTHPPKKK